MAHNPWAALQACWQDAAEREALERSIHGEPPAATTSDALRQWAHNVGAQRPNQAWLCSDYDTWEPNPYYRGREEPHPEDDHAWEDIAAWRARRAIRASDIAADNTTAKRGYALDLNDTAIPF